MRSDDGNVVIFWGMIKDKREKKQETYEI